MNRRTFIRRALQGAAALSSIAFLGLRGVPEIVAQGGIERVEWSDPRVRKALATGRITMLPARWSFIPYED